MKKKIDILTKMMAEERWEEALKFAAKFPRLGGQRNAILSASSALLSPEFYTSMGKNSDEIVAAGIAALKEKYATYF